MRKLLLALFVLCSFFASAQKIQKVNTYGYEYNRFISDTLFALPGDTFAVPAAYQAYPFLARKATTLYVWNTSTFIWQALAGGSGSTNTSVGSGYKVAIDGTNNIKSLTGGYGITLDSATSNQVGIKADTATLFPAVRATIPAGGGTPAGNSRNIQFNSNGTFAGNDSLKWAAGNLGVTGSLSSTNGTVLSIGSSAANYLWAADATPGSGEHYGKAFYSSNYGILEVSHPAGGNFAFRNVGAGGLYLQSASAQPVILYAASTQILTATGTGVGIGTGETSPDSTLDVAGSFELSGNAKFGAKIHAPNLSVGAGTKAVRWDASNGFVLADTTAGGSSQTLAQTTALGHTTTDAMVSTDSLKAYNFNSNGGAMIGDSSALVTDSIIVYGASIEKTDAVSPNADSWVNVIARNLGTSIINKAISSTSFTKISAGDSSFMERLYTIPNYRTTLRYIVIGCSNILNDMQFHVGLTNTQANIAKAIDTLTINRGFPLNRIVIAIPGVIGTVSAAINNDSLGYYVRAAISTAKSKGVYYSDAYTYTKNYGGSANVKVDSIHPTNAGHYQLSEAFSYRVSDVKISNSIRINRDSYTKGSSTVLGKLNLSSASTSTGNFTGQLNWGTSNNLNGNAIVLLDHNNTAALRVGWGYNTATGRSLMFGRLIQGGLMFGTGLDCSNMTTSNANFYLDQAATAPVANSGRYNIFNGTTNMYNIVPTTISFPATTGNVVGKMNFGNAGAINGVWTLDAGSTSLRAGMVYDGTVGPSYIFGRGSNSLFFGVGLDNTNMTTSNAAFYINGSNQLTVNGRLHTSQGADVASTSGAMTLGTDGTQFEITGTNSITLLSNVGWQNGDEVTLMFTSTATLVNGTATSGTNITIKLAGAADFVASADDVITLVLGEIGGVQAWREKSRSVN